MKYLKVSEFAELVHIAPNTLYKRLNLGTMPKPESTVNGEGSGRPYVVWKESTVIKFKEDLTKKLQELHNEGNSIKQVSILCGIGETQITYLLCITNKVTKTSYNLFLRSPMRGTK